MYWKIQKLKWLIRWEFWKRWEVPPKITRIRVWDKGLWFDIYAFYTYKEISYFWLQACEPDLSDLFLFPKYFKIAFDKSNKRRQKAFNERLGKPFE